MKFKRILSTVLLVAVMFTTIAAALPFTASAAHSQSSASANGNVPEGYESANLNETQLEAYLKDYAAGASSQHYNSFSTAAQMLNYELEQGYLYYVNSPGKAYTMFVNKYTGFVYYVNNTTGQILTSNPINVSSVSGSEPREDLLSQITVDFVEKANSTITNQYGSLKWAAMRSQISVTSITNGFRVNYTLGDTTTRFLLPGMVIASEFEETVVLPLLNQYKELLEEYCRDEHPDELFGFFENEDYEHYNYECINSSVKSGVLRYLIDTKKFYSFLDSKSAEYKKLSDLNGAINNILLIYTLYDPAVYIGIDRYEDQLESMYDNYPITKEGTPVYVYSASQENATKRKNEKLFKQYLPEYTFSVMFAQESASGYVDKSVQKPVFRCALEYTFNSDGSISVALPASSIIFDESVYTLDRVTPLKYFGGADMTTDGYIFYPDGSGTVIEFDDFYSSIQKPNIELEAPMYGLDYCYSKLDKIDGIAHRAQVTMPVYGMVSNVKANAYTEQVFGKETVTNGYFAIIEEGSALANLYVKSGGVAHKFIGAHAYFTPYPSDEYNLSETLSVGQLGVYKMVSESKYTGSYVTRYVMLDDEDIGNRIYGENAFHKSDYVGMASYYRDYLKDKGVISALETVEEDLPLYIEVLGAMDITAKFLSFPITKTIALTKFEDVSTIYNDLSKCEEIIVIKLAEYEELARNEKDDVQKYQYQKSAERYRELVGKIQNIKNINFKLTGFANGGMESTYPAKLKWVKACGGKSDYKDLLANAAEITQSGEGNFAIYPEFDFQYVNNTAPFDGIDIDDITSLMVDNRYASKQLYDSVVQKFDSIFTYVVSPDALDGLFAKFDKKYSSYNNKNISVSTLGSKLNSNFDKDNPINREDAMLMVQDLFDTMVNEKGYSVMTDTGNLYAVEYATHILNATIDSSHHRYTSYTVPFTGMILHSYVNYTGEPINYSGSPEYDRLRAIESGAALYYIVCYQDKNIAHMKDDEDLSKYFGVDYHNWYDDIVENYAILNDLLGGLQNHEIVDHKVLLAEREIEQAETKANRIRLQAELIEFLDSQLAEKVDEALLALKGDSANRDKRIKIVVTKTALMAEFAQILQLSEAELTGSEFESEVDAVIAKYTSYYTGAQDSANTVNVEFSDFEYGTGDYVTKYSYFTDSYATDKDYVYTDYTIDNGNVTMVTYKNGDSVVRFILNYNNYKVTVNLSATETYELEAYDFIKIVD